MNALDTAALLLLCEDSSLLSSHPTWLLLDARMFVGPGISSTLATLTGCGRQVSTRPLCPPRFVRNAGLFSTIDLAPRCPELRAAIALGSAMEAGGDALQWKQWKSRQQALGIKLLNASAAPPLAAAVAASVGPYCKAGLVHYPLGTALPPVSDPYTFPTMGLALAGRGPMHAAATAARDKRRAIAKGRYNYTFARPGLLQTLHTMGIDNFTHPHAGVRAVLYEYQDIDLYRWDPSWR